MFDFSPAPAPVKKAAKPRKPAKPPEHPKYNVMIAAAVKSLNERSGSSRHTILKYILANYKVINGPTINAHLKRALRARFKSPKKAKSTKKLSKSPTKLPKSKKVAKAPAIKKAGKPKTPKKAAAKKIAKK
ncbi:histone H1, sperm-like [Babylonia areolata]|uniref:histone H1, sperm-like n=1 Tax=Babylonia areolata TaxID=304850 RepID=UPI003FD26BC2